MSEPSERAGPTFLIGLVAARLREAADLLAAQEDNRFRVSAYRRAADSISALGESVETIFLQGGVEAIAPKRFNPGSKAWLPILHTIRGRWHFTALHSNTSRAHELGRVWDWVVICFYDDDHSEAQRTIVTETRGPLLEHRIVRGREAECMTCYETAMPSDPSDH